MKSRRRRVMRQTPALALVVVGAVALAACGGSSSSSSAPAASETPSSAASPSETPSETPSAVDSAAAFPTKGTGTVNLYNWTDYIDPKMLERFKAETGITVKLDTYDSNETMLAKIQPGNPGYDVIVPSDYMVKIMVEQGLLEEVNVASFPNGSKIEPKFVDVYWDKGRKFSAPYMYGTTSIAYDKTKVPGGKIDSWTQFFNPDPSLAGKIGTLNDQIEVGHAALFAVGAKPCSEDPADYQKIDDLLKAWKPSVKVINSDNVIERMASGAQSMHMMWNGAFHRAKKTNPNIEFAYPKEGMNLWSDNIAIPKGAPNLENAKIFINWMMDPKNAAGGSNFTGYNNSISGSAEFLDKDLASDPAVNPPAEVADLAKPIEACSKKAADFYSKVWENFKSA